MENQCPWKTCSKCKKPKQKTEFGLTKGAIKSWCKQCLRDYQNARNKTQNEKRRKRPEIREQQRRHNLEKYYSLSVEDYDKMMDFQGGVCFLCKNHPKTKKLGVDHDHKTGAIRGLLCSWCNVALGKFRDSAEIINRAAEYFKSYPATSALGAPRFGVKGRISNKMSTMKRLNPGRFD